MTVISILKCRSIEILLIFVFYFRPMNKGSDVYVIPVKKEKGEFLTRNKLESIINEIPQANENLKCKLLNLIKLKRVSVEKINNTITKRIKSNRIRKTCKRLQKTRRRTNKLRQRPVVNINVSPSVNIKVNGNSFRSDDSLFNDAENLFTVTTLLTNVHDKSQIEQLCQLVIDSLFKLKNTNVPGTMSKLEIFLCQDVISKTTPTTETTGSNEDELINKRTCLFEVNGCRVETISMPSESQCANENNSQQEPSVAISDCTTPAFQEMTHQENDHSLNVINSSQVCTRTRSDPETHIKLDLNVLHDHNYLAADKYVLFEKPLYLVKLVSSDAFKARKKTRILKQPPQTAKSQLRELSKLREQIVRLKHVLKKKNANIQDITGKLKYVGSELCEVKGRKRISYPKVLKESDPCKNLHMPSSENNDEENSGKSVPKKRRKRRKQGALEDVEIPKVGLDTSVTSNIEERYDLFDLFGNY